MSVMRRACRTFREACSKRRNGRDGERESCGSVFAMRFRDVGVGALVVSLWIGSARPAFAVTDEERAAARAAAGQGADAFDGGRWQEAVDLFTRAEAIVHSPIHLLYLGRAQLKLGQWVKAYENFNRIKREGAPANAPAAVKKAVDDASKELTQLEPQLPQVAAKVKNATADVEVQMDGTTIPPLLVGLMRPVDPGQHVFVAKTATAASESVTLDVQPSSRHTVELELKPLQAPTPVTPVAAPPPVTTPAPVSVDSGTSSSGSNGLRIASYGALGLGVVGVGLGTVFLIQAGSTQKEADDLCPSEPCDPARKPQIDAKDDDAASQRTLALVGYGVGGVALAAGVTLFILSGNQSERATSGPSIQPYVGYRSAGITGTF